MHQTSLFGDCPVAEAVEALAGASSAAERGAIYTRRAVVEFILDLVGWTADQPLPKRRLLEPAFGGGSFLYPAVDRLLAAWRSQAPGSEPLARLGPCIVAVELHRDTFNSTRSTLIAQLQAAGIGAGDARQLAHRWLAQGDFLLADLPQGFDAVVGNPPYVRTELVPDALMAAYRNRYTTIYDRADLYVPFIERSLDSLKPGGVLGFICADRWMKNKYGGPLRAHVAQGFHLRAHVDMGDAQVFDGDVTAYPAVTVIAREPAASTRVARFVGSDWSALRALGASLAQRQDSAEVRSLDRVVLGSAPWLLSAAEPLRLVRRLEDGFPAIEQTGCKVGIGVATGADDVFIGDDQALDVEADRKLPLATTKDIVDGGVNWRGLFVINPFTDDGALVNLSDFPRLRRHLMAHRAELEARHVARKFPANWYRTIDRITPALATAPKLLIPDIQGAGIVVHEPGRLYPHHNLYHLTTDRWDLHALQAVMLSGVASLFVAAYSTRMRGGFLRFQAQYLRRIRLPHWQQVSGPLRSALTQAGRGRDPGACRQAVQQLYELDAAECRLLETAGG